MAKKLTNGMSERHQRLSSYGQHRTFAGIEKFAIHQRTKVAERVLIQISAQKETLSVLELGCGFYGANLYYLKSRFPEASFTGVDLQVNTGANVNSVELVEADLSIWQPTRRYDCVLSLAVVEHLTDLQKHFDLLSLSL